MTMDQVLGLYNYWIVIFLMMTGFYIVIARENLIKTIIGLNIFQTSVFLLYITMGKVNGGTAPILKNPISHDHPAHGEEHHEAGHAALSDAVSEVETFTGGMQSEATESSSNEVLDELLDAVDAESAGQIVPVGFDEEVAELSNNDVLNELLEAADTERTIQAIPVGFKEDVADHVAHANEASEILYSNPLPSVLMLTAIVVGIATTALALALIVRIREDYGTIEEDEILRIDRAS